MFFSPDSDVIPVHNPFPISSTTTASTQDVSSTGRIIENVSEVVSTTTEELVVSSTDSIIEGVTNDDETDKTQHPIQTTILAVSELEDDAKTPTTPAETVEFTSERETEIMEGESYTFLIMRLQGA